MDVPYADLATEAQVEVVTAVARQALPAFGFAGAGLELVLHEYNSTFRVTEPDGTRWALRVNINSASQPEHIQAQQAWLQGVATHTDVRVPVPRSTTAGQWFTSVPCPACGGDLRVTCAGWLDGDECEVVDPGRARLLGRAMATLHQFSAHWRLPDGAALPQFDEPLFGDANRLGDPDVHAQLDLTADDVAVLEQAMQQSGAAFVAAGRQFPAIAIHADLHAGNLLFDSPGGSGEPRMAVLDIDDMGVGAPVLDLAIASYYLRGPDVPDAAATEQALRAGYREVAALPAFSHDDPEAEFDGLVAARALLLANYMVSTSTAAHRAEAHDYVRLTVGRLRRWLDSGRFTR